MNYEDLNPEVKRRIKFLLDEARLNSPKDQVITFLMRVISNYSTVGIDANSPKIKKMNKRVSEKALAQLKSSNSITEWTKVTINEHYQPLKVTWLWIKENAAKGIKEKDIWDLFLSTKMVTILKTEDLELNRLGQKSSISEICRYEAAGIVIKNLDITPEELWKQHNS